jgi:D-alanine-D-alanine ligase
MKKIRVGILLGGASSEREISLLSGKTIADHLPKSRYEAVLMDTLSLMAYNPCLPDHLREEALALAGRRSLPPAPADALPSSPSAAEPEPTGLELAAWENFSLDRKLPIDVAFLALHGKYGEDGTVQGMLDLLGIPYVGSGTLASALALDKVMAKKVLAAEQIPVPAGVALTRTEFAADPGASAREIAARIFPAVVKPVRQGSSIGVFLVRERDELRPAIEKAFAYDSRVLVEELIEGTEVSVGVLGNREPFALPVVEIVPRGEFFDYGSKYDSAMAEEICPARLPDEVTRRVQELAVRAHVALSCRGVSRVDFILAERGPVVLEVNTLPGLTPNSLLPKAARTYGMSFENLLEKLIELAMERED